MEKNIYSPSYYQILEIQTHATIKEIKAAWRKLIKIHHEDVNPESKDSAKEKSQLINKAYEELSNAEKRTKYDTELSAYNSAREEKEHRYREAQRTSYHSTSFNFAAALLVILLIAVVALIFSSAKSNNTAVS